MKKKLIIGKIISMILVMECAAVYAQEATMQRVRTADSVPGWGTPLVGEEIFAEYFIMPGDELLISAWKNEDLTRVVTVKGDGKISYPLIGSIRAAGLTVDQLQGSLREALTPFIRSEAGNTIAPGDEIEVFLWRNPALSRFVAVRQDGKISYPLIGTIQAAGLTTEEFQDKLREGFARYVRIPTENIIEPSDEIEIFVWKEQDLSRVVTVRGDGNISYPLIGTVKAAGLTAEQFENNVEAALAEYIKVPDVSVLIRKKTEEQSPVSARDLEDVVVFIKSYSEDKIEKLKDITVEVVSSSGNKVLVFGEVASQGIYLYKGAINLLEAIAMAGGIKTTGKRESIIVVSGNMTENPEARRVNLFHVLREGTSAREIVLKPNDVIYVPRTFMADVNRFYADIQPTLDQGMSIFDWRDRLRTWYKHWDQ